MSRPRPSPSLRQARRGWLARVTQGLPIAMVVLPGLAAENRVVGVPLDGWSGMTERPRLRLGAPPMPDSLPGTTIGAQPRPRRAGGGGR